MRMTKRNTKIKSKYKYFNRDLSWLRFNHRVLQEMMDTRNPLFERLKFAAIFSSNLDEFFEVRVSEIRRIKNLDKKLRKKLITKPNKLLKKIKKLINELEKEYNRSLFNELLPELRKIGFNILKPEEFDSNVKLFCYNYYEEHIKSKLKSQSKFKIEEDRLFVKSGQVYLIGKVDERLYFYELPSDHKRFIQLSPGVDSYLFLDDLVKLNLQRIHNTVFYSMKASRDADLHIQDEYSGNLKEKIENSLTNRDTGQFSTSMIDKEMPLSYLDLLFPTLNITGTDIIFGGRYHRLRDLFSLDLPGTSQHNMETLKPLRSSSLACHSCILEAIKEKDRLLYYPYESFEEVVRFVLEAAEHPTVNAIKMTLYRVSKTSAIAKALLQALKNGKKVCVFIETKARFDESNNLYWGETLTKAGATVIYSYPGIKVHSKIMYISAKDSKGPQEYGYIGTGNFNEKTSKIYTDYGLLTANKKITTELGQVFQLLERKIIVPKLKLLLVAPFNVRSTISELIRNEISYAKHGRAAYLTFKMNSLQDRKIIKALYKASNAGVKIKLLVRGICCLRPGVKGLSENIEVLSIIDRFLEHGRVYIFGNNGKEKMYIGSADMMTRNLNNRIEVMTPILDGDVYDKIKSTLEMQLRDETKARIIDHEQSNEYASENEDYKSSSQHKIYAYLQDENNTK